MVLKCLDGINFVAQVMAFTLVKKINEKKKIYGFKVKKAVGQNKKPLGKEHFSFILNLNKFS